MTFAVQAFADCAIAVSLCTLLVRRRTGFKRCVLHLSSPCNYADLQPSAQNGSSNP